MTDGIIKGTGNSRYLRGPANIRTLYPTYDDLLDALAAGTLPVDLNGINPAGWDVVGNKLDKATLLTDALCTALGLATTATPTQAMDKLRQLVGTAQAGVDNGVKTQIVSYMGTGKYGGSSPCSVTFSFAPTLVLMLGYYFLSGSTKIYQVSLNFSSDGTMNTMVPSLLTTTPAEYLGFTLTNTPTSGYGYKSADGKTIYWYHTRGASEQYNYINQMYYVFGIG